MNSAQQQSHSESLRSDLRELLELMREKGWTILLCVLMTGAAGVAYCVFCPKIYRAQAVVQVEQEGRKVLKIEGVESEDLKAEESLKTIEQNFTSPELLLGLIDRNNLRGDPAFLPKLKRPCTDNQMVEALARQVSAKVRHGTRLIDLAVEDQTPVMAQKLADSLVKEFSTENFERHLKVSELVNGFLLEQAELLKSKLGKSEKALQAYREENQGILFDERQDTISNRLRELDRMETEAQGNRLKLEADYGEIKKLGNGSPATLLAIPSVASSPGVLDVEKTIREKEAEVATLRKLYGERHPISLAVVSQLQELKAGLDQAVLKAAEVVAIAYQTASATEEKIKAALHEEERVTLESNRLLIQYSRLRREVDADRALWESVLARMKEMDVAKGAEQDIIRIVSNPLLPDRPNWPSRSRVLLISVLCGLVLGLGFSLLTRMVEGSFRTPDEAERRLGMRVLGAIPKASKPESPNGGPLLVEQRGSAASECFRSLRTSLSLLAKDGTYRTFLFTSAIRSEGKSFCAINCAVAFAQQGLETLLIDANLRMPSVGTTLLREAPVQGLTDILTHRTNLDDAARRTDIDKLSLLCAGTRLDTPAELLAGSVVGHLIAEAAVKYDRVVIDSAPLGGVSDTLLLAQYVKATCLVISAQTSAQAVYQATQQLGTTKGMLAGLILNRVRRTQRTRYGQQYPQVTSLGVNAGKHQKGPKPAPQLQGPVIQEL